MEMYDGQGRSTADILHKIMNRVQDRSIHLRVSTNIQIVI